MTAEGADSREVVTLDDDCSIVLHRAWATDGDSILAELIERSDWDQETITLFGKRVQQPRLTAWFGIAMDSATRYRTTRPTVKWPESLATMKDALADLTGVPFNSALANLYRDGMDSVAWHADDEPALGTDPVIASVSLGATRRFALRSREGDGRFTLALGHADLLIMKGKTQSRWMHSVPKSRRVVGPR